jgi:S-formylglutathione hydrolase FrmB
MQNFILKSHIQLVTLLAALFLLKISAQAQPRLEVLEFSSHVLKGNPLHDPVARQIAVFLPTQYRHESPLPVVYYLPGYGGSSDQFIKQADKWRLFTQKLADEVTPVVLVVVDGRNRWGGSQYINSSAQGNYADYICDEIVTEVESHFGITTNRPRRIIAGHSSGGFGALRLGMFRPQLFDGVIALSPDSDFPLSHLPFVQRPGVSGASPAQVRSLAAPGNTQPSPMDGSLRMALGLSAAYAPRGWFHHGQFSWLYDAQGHFQETVWQLWLENDPLTMVRKNRKAFLPSQSVYLEGPTQDAWRANVGAREIYGVIKNRSARCTFYEPPGKHGDHLPERLERGLAWFFDRPMQDIK